MTQFRTGHPHAENDVDLLLRRQLGLHDQSEKLDRVFERQQAPIVQVGR